MCLNRRYPQPRKTGLRKAYKLVYGGYTGPFMCRPLPYNTWLKSKPSPATLTITRTGEDYPCGFHCYATRKGAEKAKRILVAKHPETSLYRELKLRPAWVADIVARGDDGTSASIRRHKIRVLVAKRLLVATSFADVPYHKAKEMLDAATAEEAKGQGTQDRQGQDRPQPLPV